MRTKSGGRWPGTWAAICDRCGFRFPSDKLRKDWQGLMVCESDYEPRHEQDFLRVRQERGGVPWARPEVADQFVFVCDLWTSSPLADYGAADCATVGGNTNIQLLVDTFGTSSIADIAISSTAVTGLIS
jgi:hypothetical protein